MHMAAVGARYSGSLLAGAQSSPTSRLYDAILPSATALDMDMGAILTVKPPMNCICTEGPHQPSHSPCTELVYPVRHDRNRVVRTSSHRHQINTSVPCVGLCIYHLYTDGSAIMFRPSVYLRGYTNPRPASLFSDIAACKCKAVQH